MAQILSVEITLVNDIDFDNNSIQLKSATPSLDEVVVVGLKYFFANEILDAVIAQEVRSDLVARGYSIE